MYFTCVPGTAASGARPVPGDETVDRRLLVPSDGADHLATRALGAQRCEGADEVADLLLTEEEALRVGRLPFQQRVIVVDDGELDLREALRRGGDRIALRVTDPDHELVALADERGDVRDVVR